MVSWCPVDKELMDFLINSDGRTDIGRSRDAIASKNHYTGTPFYFKENVLHRSAKGILKNSALFYIYYLLRKIIVSLMASM